ncbi:MAG: M23 family metallopeptidase [Gemmatimonadota bacterium]
MAGTDRRPWTLLFVREDGTDLHALRIGRWTWSLAALGVVVVLVGAGVFLGRFLERRAENLRVDALEAEVARLAAGEAKMLELGARLEQVEQEYRRLQRALTGERVDGRPEVALPAPFTATRPALATGREADVPAWPLAERGFVTRTFGSRTGTARTGHPGIDIAVPLGSYVRATRAGVVEATGRDSVYGLFLRIAHGDGVSSLYGHNSWLFAATGDSVERLEVIALTGNTGRSTAPHLHFEIIRDGELVDPLGYVGEGRTGYGGAGRNSVEPR